MAPTSSGITSPLPIASSLASRSHIRFHLPLHSWFLAKATVRRSLKDFSSGGQRLYLRIYSVEGRIDSCLATMVHAGWVVRSESWPSLQLLPESLCHLRMLSLRLLPTIRPPPKPPHPSGYTFFGSPTLLYLICVASLVLARERQLSSFRALSPCRKVMLAILAGRMMLSISYGPVEPIYLYFRSISNEVLEPFMIKSCGELARLRL
ncbi:hypothetical protein V6N13_001362 [Hibiscus sabdariffa]